MPYAARTIPEFGRHGIRKVFLKVCLRSYRNTYRVIDDMISVITVY